MNLDQQFNLDYFLFCFFHQFNRHLINMNSISNNNGTNSNIKVYIRLRPICSEKSELPIDYEFNKTEIQLRKANQTRSYCFDGIFGDQAEQSDLSEVIIDPFIQQVIEGFNCTVLAYGQTGKRCQLIQMFS